MNRLGLAAGVVFLLLLLGGGGLWWYYQPERALPRDWQRLLQAVEKRQWDRVETYLAQGYTDAWDQDRASALGRAEDVLRIFLVVRFTTVTDEKTAEPESFVLTSSTTARQRVRLQMGGSGGPLAAEWIRRFNQLPGSFTIEWQRATDDSGEVLWPPRWEVLSVDHDASSRLRY